MTRGELMNLIMDRLKDRSEVDRVYMQVNLDTMKMEVVVESVDGQTHTVTVTEV